MTAPAWPERVDAVLVDVGGVLYGPDVEGVARAVAACGLTGDRATVERAHSVAQTEADAARDPRRYAAAYVAALDPAGDRRQELSERLFRDGRRAHPWLRRNPVVEALAGLRRRVPALGIVSNANGDLEELLREDGVCQRGEGPGVRVDVFIDSGRVGVRKPDPAIFRIAIREGRLEPARTLHVGDSVLLDVEPAGAAGLTPVHYDPFDVCPGRRDHLHVRSLTDVAARQGPSNQPAGERWLR